VLGVDAINPVGGAQIEVQRPPVSLGRKAEISDRTGTVCRLPPDVHEIFC